MGIRLISAQIGADKFHWILTVETSFLGLFIKRRQFIGNGTVWRAYPSFRRAGTEYEKALGQLWMGAHMGLKSLPPV